MQQIWQNNNYKNSLNSSPWSWLQASNGDLLAPVTLLIPFQSPHWCAGVAQPWPGCPPQLPAGSGQPSIIQSRREPGGTGLALFWSLSAPSLATHEIYSELIHHWSGGTWPQGKGHADGGPMEMVVICWGFWKGNIKKQVQSLISHLYLYNFVQTSILPNSVWSARTSSHLDSFSLHLIY